VCVLYLSTITANGLDRENGQNFGQNLGSARKTAAEVLLYRGSEPGSPNTHQRHTMTTITGYSKRETACWGEVYSWRGVCSMESETVWHQSCRPGSDSPYRLTAVLTVEELSGEDGFRVMIREQSIREQEPYRGERTVYWYESPQFNRLSDAQLWADWAIVRWHQTERFTASGAIIRTDLDDAGNPIV